MKFPFSIIIVASFIIVSIVYPAYTLSKDEKIANKITLQTAKKISTEKGLIPMGIGGQMMDEIKMLMLGFDCRKIVDIETARGLLVYCVEEFLTAINASEEIRPYLYSYPFTDQNVQLEIFFRNPDASNVSIGNIVVAVAKCGRICYEVYESNRPGLQTLYQETYEEAFQKVKR